MRQAISILLCFLTLITLCSQELSTYSCLKVQRDSISGPEFRSGTVVTVRTELKACRGIINEIHTDSIFINGEGVAITDISSIQEGARRGLISASLLALGAGLVVGDIIMLQDDKNRVIEGQLAKFGVASIVGAVTTLPKKRFKVKKGYTFEVERCTISDSSEVFDAVPVNHWIHDSTLLVLNFHSRRKDFTRLFRSGDHVQLISTEGEPVSGRITSFTEKAFAVDGMIVNYTDIKKLKKVYHNYEVNLLTIAGGAAFIYGAIELASIRNAETFEEGLNAYVEGGAILYLSSAAVLTGLVISHRARNINMKTSKPQFLIIPLDQHEELNNGTRKLVR